MKNASAGTVNSHNGAALAMILSAQPAAAQQDILIGQQLEAMRLANQNLEQRLAMDIQFIEATNDRINVFNERTLPVLRAITGQDLGPEPEKWSGWWTDQLGYVYQSNMPADEADLFRLRRRRRCVYPFGLLRRWHAGPDDGWSAADRIHPGWRPGTCRKALRAGSSHLSPLWPRIEPPSSPTLRIASGDETDRGDRHPPLLESRQGLDNGPRTQAG